MLISIGATTVQTCSADSDNAQRLHTAAMYSVLKQAKNKTTHWHALTSDIGASCEYNWYGEKSFLINLYFKFGEHLNLLKCDAIVNSVRSETKQLIVGNKPAFR